LVTQSTIAAFLGTLAGAAIAHVLGIPLFDVTAFGGQIIGSVVAGIAVTTTLVAWASTSELSREDVGTLLRDVEG
jgi:hypothetical protein